MLSVLWESLGTESFSYSKVVKCSGSRWKAVSKRFLNVKIITPLIISHLEPIKILGRKLHKKIKIILKILPTGKTTLNL